MRSRGHEGSSSEVIPPSAAVNLEGKNQQLSVEIAKRPRTSISLKHVLPPNPLKDKWMEDYGCQLFDVVSKVQYTYH